ncbi:MAG: hypothetical protein C4519_22330 [Desulfobacteraceae bacterium]|nr:MAG: hypothetical protein C4519_22330 [Desulfobacteraceae bacterium]
MLDISVAYNRYRFLGNEFLTWLWFALENDMDSIRQCDAEMVDLFVGNRMVLENRLANGKENITIKGDAAGLEEAMLALRKGALITDLHLVYKSGTVQWRFAIKGEGLSFSGLKLPETGPIETREDMEGIILEKIFLYEKPFEFVDKLYQVFIKIRLSDAWNHRILPALKKWLQRGGEHDERPSAA